MQKKRVIGMDCRMYGPAFTGIGRYTKELATRLPEIMPEYNFVFFCAKDAPPKKKNTEIVRVDVPHYSIKEQTTLLWAILKARPHLMHFTHFNAPLLYLGNSVVTMHDVILSKFPGKKMRQWHHRLGYALVSKKAVRQSTHIITVSQHTKKDVVELFGAPPEKIHTVYNGVSAGFATHTKSSNEKKQIAKKYGAQPYLFYCGVWRDHKNIARLVAAMEMLKNRGCTARLLLAGREDPLYAKPLLRYIDKKKLPISAIGLLPEKELGRVMRTARGFVFPSLYEGFGLPPLEAMAAGTPVASSNASCMPEVIGRGNAIFFNPGSTKDIAKKIEELWHNAALRKKISARGKKRAAEFRWDSCAMETATIYEKALR